MAEATRADNALFHVQVRLPEHERLTRQQWEHSADRIEKRLGLTGQPRAVYFHVNDTTGEEHMHVAWSLIDAEAMKAKPVPFFKFRLKALARELEQEFDITRVKNEREGPIKYAAKKNEQQQAQRLGTNKDEIRNTIRACWEHSDCGRSFEAALAHEGMILTLGDRRNLVVVDQAGGLHALGKRILDVNKSQILARLADLDLSELPNLKQAQSLVRELSSEHRREKQAEPWDRDRADRAWQDSIITAAIENEKTERRYVDPKRERETRAGGRENESREPQPQKEKVYTSMVDRFKDAGLEMAETTAPAKPLEGMEKKLWNAYRSGPDADDFAAALDSRGIAFARVNGDEAYRSEREAQFAKAAGPTAPVYLEGAIVVVRTPGLEYHREGERAEAKRVHKLDQVHAEKYLEILSIDKSKLNGIDATKTMLDASAQDRAAYWQAVRLERAANIDRFEPFRSAKDTTAAVRKAGRRAIGVAFGAAEKIFEGLFSILDPPVTPSQRLQAAGKARDERENDAERSIDFSRYTSDRAQEQRSQREQQAARDRQRELERER